MCFVVVAFFNPVACQYICSLRLALRWTYLAFCLAKTFCTLADMLAGFGLVDTVQKGSRTRCDEYIYVEAFRSSNLPDENDGSRVQWLFRLRHQREAARQKLSSTSTSPCRLLSPTSQKTDVTPVSCNALCMTLKSHAGVT